MLRQRSPIRSLTVTDREAALAICAQDPPANVFVAARITEGVLSQQPGSMLGRFVGGDLTGLAWASANVVPVGLDEDGVLAMSAKLRRMKRSVASIFGPSDQVLGLWSHLYPVWGRPRAIRAEQPLLATSTRPSELGIEPDPDVRLAEPVELDLVVPAAAHMFTEEIGYPPFVGSDRGYRVGVAALIRAGHTFVRTHEGRVIFKADVGSLALDCAQIQGVWVDPQLRGQGLAVPAMAAVVEQVLDTMAGTVSLYVNDYNAPARAVYARCGFREVGSFTTVLM